MAYSTMVAPDSSRRNFCTSCFMGVSRKCLTVCRRALAAGTFAGVAARSPQADVSAWDAHYTAGVAKELTGINEEYAARRINGKY
jgi:hypothetical protein